jgi:Zn-dependent peptidase ImmA (M78 family)
LRIAPDEELPPERLAEDLGVTLWSCQDIAGLALDVRDRLEGALKDEWSAVTIMAGPKPVIVFNASHSRRRRVSTLLHEMAHLLLDHTPGNMFFGANGLALRTFDQTQESEADWLAGCLVLPRETLLSARKRGLTNEGICERHSASEDMLRFRLNATGVDRQLQARRRGRATA